MTRDGEAGPIGAGPTRSTDILHPAADPDKPTGDETLDFDVLRLALGLMLIILLVWR